MRAIANGTARRYSQRRARVIRRPERVVVRELPFRPSREPDLAGTPGASRERAERAQRERDTRETRARPRAVGARREALAIAQTRGERAGRISRPLTAQVRVI